MVNFDYLYNPDVAKTILSKNYLLNKKLGFQVIEHGTILPHKSVNIPGKWHFGQGGIVDKNGNYIESSSLHPGVGEPYTVPRESILHSSETVIYLGMFYRVWGHDLTDNIRRVWFLKSDTFKSEFKNCPLVYIPYKDGTYTIEKQPSLKRLLEILEVDLDNLQPITQPTQYDKIILPDGSFSSPHLFSNYKVEKGFTAEYRETIDHVRNFAFKNRSPTSIKKIYFFNGRRGVGEERIAEYFKSKGYDVVSPEKLSLDEQLNLLINAESFASVGCSAAHNSLFCRDDTETIFIPRTATKFDYYQEIINQVHPLNVNYVDSVFSVFSRGIALGLHCYIISKQLKRFFGDKWDGYEDDDFKIFLQYFKDSLRINLAPNLDSISYYGKFFPEFMEQLKQRENLIISYDMPPRWDTFQTLTYQTHIARKAWSPWVLENTISNELNQPFDIQAIKINFPTHKIYYSVYFNDAEGWSEEVTGSEQAGTTGKAKAIFGIRIRLDEAGAREFDIFYRVHKFDGTWTDWAKNGEAIYSHGQKLNAVQIKLETKT